MTSEHLINLNPALSGRLVILDETGSTNIVVKELLKQGKSRPIVIARAQTSGRGRAGRSFGSPVGTGLYITFGLPLLSDPELPLTALIGCCVARAIEGASGCEARLKWVNDVLVNQKKVCGILCEAAPDGIAAGIGINVNTPADFFAGAGLPHASSLLAEGGEAVELLHLADRLIREVDGLYERLGDPDYINNELDIYHTRLLTLGRQVRVIAADGSAREGLALDIDSHANLIVDFGGYTETVNFGDVSVRGLYGYV